MSISKLCNMRPHFDAKPSIGALLRGTNRFFWVSWGGLISYKLADIGLAYFLGLETWQHGTRLKPFLKIQYGGANPSCGGNDQGACSTLARLPLSMDSTYASMFKDNAKRFKSNSRGYFHVTRDPWYYGTTAILYPRMFSTDPRLLFLLEVYALNGIDSSKRSSDSALFRQIAWNVLTGVWIPLLRFHFDPQKTPSLEIDQDSDGLGGASKTHEAISPRHLGLTGSLYQGLNSRTLDRVRENPYQTLMGAVCLASSSKLAHSTRRWLSATPTPPKSLIKRVASRIGWGTLVLPGLFL